MAIDIEIIPRHGPICWGELRSAIVARWETHPKPTVFDCSPDCFNYLEGQVVADDHVLLPENSYVFQERRPSILVLSVDANDTVSSELETLEDFFSVHGERTIRGVADDWARLGYSYTVRFGGGDAGIGEKSALLLIKALVAAVKGYAWMMERHTFACGCGLFSAEAFQRIEISETSD